MQREEAGGIVISCDFCGTDWDEMIPMIEGHRGSVICLSCVEKALTGVGLPPGTETEVNSDGDAPPGATSGDTSGGGGGGEFACTMCVREHLPGSLARWASPDHPAVVCQDCIDQAARAFDRDKETDWSRPRG